MAHDDVVSLFTELAALPSPPGDERAVADVVARWPRFLDAWAQLGQLGRDDVECYAYHRAGYHRGLDRLRARGWRGSGYVRWRHPENRGFLRAIARHLKIDEEALIAAYVAATNDSPERRTQAAESPARSLHVVWISAAVLLLAVAIAAGGYLAYHRSGSHSRHAVPPPAPNTATVDPLRH